MTYPTSTRPPVPDADTLRRALAPGPWLTLQCARCDHPYKSQRLAVRLCPSCAAGGAQEVPGA